MLTSEVLNRAADLIEERGWGHGPESWGRKDEAAPLCLEGGIAVASGVRAIGAVLVNNCPAARAVHDYLQLSEREELWDWNDRSMTYCLARDEPFGSAHDRSPSEVIEVLRAAAAIEQARESQPSVVSA